MIYFNKELGLKYYDVTELQRVIDKIAPTATGRGKHKYFNMPSAFDIEDYSFDKISLMYHWQFGFMNASTGYTYCFVGRESTDLVDFIETLSDIMLKKDKKGKILIYVHNLSHEYYFLRGILNLDSYFVTKQNRYLYATYKNIEFRCSYQLSGCGLASLVQYIPNPGDVRKMVGDLDYDKPRSPISDMTDKEIAYCLQDVRVVCKYINTKLQEYGELSKIPLTKTKGATQRALNYCIPKGKDTMSDMLKKRYIREIYQLKFHSDAELQLATDAFMAGHTSVNPNKVGKTLFDVTCWDYSSSYPYCCCCEEFPKAYIDYYIDKDETFIKNEINLNHAFICELELIDVSPKKYKYDNSDKAFGVVWDYFIPSSKCLELENEKLCNGKVVSADRLTICCTNLDYEVYKDYYSIKEIKVNAIVTYTKGFLPRPFIEYILKLYASKTTLKGIENRELDYILAKEDINSVSYGVNVKNPLMEALQYDEDEGVWRESIKGTWIEDIYDLTDEEDETKYLIDKARAYNRKLISGQILVPYVAAIFIPSIGRYNLAHAIFNAGINNIFDYSDTDSIYEEGDFPFIDEYNECVEENMNDLCEFYHFDKNIWKPKNKKDEEKPLGFFDFQGHYKYFKALRAKTYICIDDNDELHVKIAGLDPVKGAIYLSKFDKTSEIYKDDKGKTHVIIHDYKPVFDAFKIGMKVPSEETGQLGSDAFRTEHKGTLVDYQNNKYNYDIKGGVSLYKVPFEIKENDDIEQLFSFLVKTYYNVYYD